MTLKSIKYSPAPMPIISSPCQLLIFVSIALMANPISSFIYLFIYFFFGGGGGVGVGEDPDTIEMKQT